MDDPTNPYNNSAQAQSFTPPLSEPWDYGKDQIRGVNLGGWLVLEPFIAPSLFEKYQNATPSPALPGGLVVDEWSLSVAMLNDTSDGGGIEQIEHHYETFIVRLLVPPVLQALVLTFHVPSAHRRSRTSHRSRVPV